MREAWQERKGWAGARGEEDYGDGDRDRGGVGGVGLYPKTQCARDWLFERVVAMAVEADVHPLDLHEVWYLDAWLWRSPGGCDGPGEAVGTETDCLSGGFSTTGSARPDDLLNLSNPPYSTSHSHRSPFHPTPSPPPPSPPSPPQQPPQFRPSPPPPLTLPSISLPWSFESHVLCPLRYLARIGIDTDLSFAELEKYDGWVILTLLAKIERSVRVGRVGRWKRYDGVGNVVEEGEGLVGGEGEGVVREGKRRGVGEEDWRGEGEGGTGRRKGGRGNGWTGKETRGKGKKTRLRAARMCKENQERGRRGAVGMTCGLRRCILCSVWLGSRTRHAGSGRMGGLERWGGGWSVSLSRAIFLVRAVRGLRLVGVR